MRLKFGKVAFRERLVSFLFLKSGEFSLKVLVDFDKFKFVHGLIFLSFCNFFFEFFNFDVLLVHLFYLLTDSPVV